MIQSILVYGLFTFFMFLLTTISTVPSTNYTSKKGWVKCGAFLSLLFFGFISGIRYDVGVDHLTYLNDYVNLASDKIISSDWEPGFLWFSKLLAKSGFHYSIYFGFLALIQLFFVLYTFKNEQHLLPFIIVVIILNGTFFSWMNGIRQSIVCCVFIYSVQFIRLRKPISYFGWVLIGFLIHRSALILLPLYFIFYFDKDFFKKIWIQFFLIFLAFFMSSLNIWNNFLSYLDKMISILGYQVRYGNIVSRMVIWEQDYSKGIRFYVPFLINLIIVAYSKRLKTIFQNTNMKVYYNLFFIGALSEPLFYNNLLIKRPFLYFTSFQFILSAYLLYYLWKKRKNNYYNIIFFFAVILMLVLIFYAYIASNYHTQFQFFWDI